VSSDIVINQEQYTKLVQIMTRNYKDFFLSPACRQYMAVYRFEKRQREVRVHESLDEGVMPGAISHNRHEIDDGTFGTTNRTLRLINPLSAIDSVYIDPHTKRVLSIGPRTEMELFHLVGVGFLPENIKAVDLISTSPWIDTGDMHALPYPDKSFDVVISSWVLGYTRDPKKAVDEMLRVVKDGGLVAIGCTFNPKAADVDYASAEDKIVGTIFRHVQQYCDLIGPKLAKILFQDEPETDETKGPVMLIARIKH
jgi:SAM-dependent methyltransferase